MQDANGIAAVINAVYAAGTDQPDWSNLLKCLRQQLGAASAALCVFDRTRANLRIVATSGVPSPAWLLHLLRDRPGRGCFTGSGFVATRAQQMHLIGAPLCDIDGSESWITLGVGMSSAGRLRLLAALEALQPHLRTSLQIYLRLGLARREIEGLRRNFDEWALGVVILRPDRVVTYMNPVATQLLTQSDSEICIRLGRLRGRSPSIDAALASVVRDCACDYRANSLVGRTVKIARRSQPPLLLKLQASAWPPGDPAANPCGCEIACLIKGVNRSLAASQPALRQTLKLTARQLDLVIGLQKRMTLQQFADARGVSLESIRTRLKRVYRMLGVNSRTRLMREAGLAQYRGC
jgi:DNA-binding CsgD family transcriptional regulator